MTPASLEALEALIAAGTPGPWGVCHVPRKGLSFVEQRNEHGAATADANRDCQPVTGALHRWKARGATELVEMIRALASPPPQEPSS